MINVKIEIEWLFSLFFRTIRINDARSKTENHKYQKIGNKNAEFANKYFMHVPEISFFGLMLLLLGHAKNMYVSNMGAWVHEVYNVSG